MPNVNRFLQDARCIDKHELPYSIRVCMREMKTYRAPQRVPDHVRSLDLQPIEHFLQRIGQRRERIPTGQPLRGTEAR
jgi:hypothetical protein